MGSNQASGLRFTGLLTPLGPEDPLTSFSISIMDFFFVQKIQSFVDFSPSGFCWLNLANAIKTGPSLTWCVSCAVCLQVWIPGEDKLHQGVDCSQERRLSSLTWLRALPAPSAPAMEASAAFSAVCLRWLRRAPPGSAGLAGLQALSFVFIPSVPLLEKQSVHFPGAKAG